MSLGRILMCHRKVLRLSPRHSRRHRLPSIDPHSNLFCFLRCSSLFMLCIYMDGEAKAKYLWASIFATKASSCDSSFSVKDQWKAERAKKRDQMRKAFLESTTPAQQVNEMIIIERWRAKLMARIRIEKVAEACWREIHHKVSISCAHACV